MKSNIDSPKYQGQRKLMVSELKSLGIKSKTVLKALNNVPRHLFMDPGLISHSYKNKAFQSFTYWSQHLYYFNAITLTKLCKLSGLKVESIKYIQRYPLSNHLYWLSEGLPGGHITWSDISTDHYFNRNIFKCSNSYNYDTNCTSCYTANGF